MIARGVFQGHGRGLYAGSEADRPHTAWPEDATPHLQSAKVVLEGSMQSPYGLIKLYRSTGVDGLISKAESFRSSPS